MRSLFVVPILIFNALLINHAQACWHKTHDTDMTVAKPKINACVTSINVSSLPDAYSFADITLPNKNKIHVTKDGGIYSLSNLIKLNAHRYTYEKGIKSPIAQVSIGFDTDKASISMIGIFGDIKEKGDYMLHISFENYIPGTPESSVTIKNVNYTTTE